ncbi:hypothetical protein A2W24_00080 [Microgenomates group bacterium RBG_16_45_19]|nr:MAG: hypothetical protein A2W24_00080 [Microgenomates group bacterium RBG_16_45_19]
MPEAEPAREKPAVVTAIPTAHPSRLIPIPRLTTILAWGLILFFLFALGSHMALRFYASALFLFYSVVSSMWIAVMLLGVFQTILMVPLRVINLIKTDNIKEFQAKIAEIETEKEQQFVLKKSVHSGERVILFYAVNFVIQAVSYLTIGRLFLIDFYKKALNPDLLYRFIPYPNYPIKGLIYRLPYPWFTETYDFGMKAVFWVWIIVSVIQAVIYAVRYVSRERAKKKAPQKTEASIMTQVKKYSTGYLVVFLVLSYIVVRHFPINWQIFYFTGNVAVPNPRFNLITAIVTFITIVWLSLSKIRLKGRLAEAAGIDQEIINETQRGMLKDTLLAATLVGIAAYLITNQIPSAFELSIFTFEVIALLSPWTLDKLIINRKKARDESAKGTKQEAGGDGGVKAVDHPASNPQAAAN